MLAVIAGQGALPQLMLQDLPERPLICGMIQSPPDRVEADHMFRLEQLGRLLAYLKVRGVTRVCFCGRVLRPVFSPWRLDLRTLALVPRILRLLRSGEDSALRVVISVFEDAGFEVVGAHDLAPRLLPPIGVLTNADVSDQAYVEATIGDQVIREQAAKDLGQASIICNETIIAREGPHGTDAMLKGLDPGAAQSALFYKAAKPGQDLRMDMPVVGINTVTGCARAGIRGIVIEYGAVMVLDLPSVLRRLNAEGMFLWVRERPN